MQPDQFKPYLSDRLWETDLYPLELIARTKVRDHYRLADGNRLMVATDRLSAFDRIVASIPLKGQILTQLSSYWFDATSDIIPNHVVGVPDPNAMICKPLEMLPVEFVVRDYLTGSTSTSIWPMYRSGDRRPYGIALPEGLRENEKLPETVITPAAKGDHDQPLTRTEAIGQGLVSEALWEEASAAALAVFARGRELAARQGVLLVDTKYEFGLDPEGRLVLADELHTPDSSRFWMADSYETRFRDGLPPNGLDKDIIRHWLISQCDPYVDPLPVVPDDILLEVAARYGRALGLITGADLDWPDANLASAERLRANLRLPA
ncbi:MAG TPA: phosphoribosylaminoimidazolesuccinocarboxamide synthase [Caulobacteraceae bacterium]|nr:phosphoribosylaminoimidazolesuccinocarboxamide synthase [Caulobacteraceae bacterium]